LATRVITDWADLIVCHRANDCRDNMMIVGMESNQQLVIETLLVPNAASFE